MAILEMHFKNWHNMPYAITHVNFITQARPTYKEGLTCLPQATKNWHSLALKLLHESDKSIKIGHVAALCVLCEDEDDCNPAPPPSTDREPPVGTG